MIDLYPDQQEFIDDLRKLWPSHKRIVGMAPTGAGKTRMAAKIIEGYVSRGLKVCFVVPRISLIAQTEKAFRELGLTDITYIWTGHETRASALITIASADSYIRREKGDFALTIVDELHHRKKKLLEWMVEYPNDRYLGLTATPYHNWIGEHFTGLAKSKPMRWLMDNNRLAKYDVYCPSKPDLTGVKIVNTAMGRDYKESDIEEVMCGYKLVGDVVQTWLECGGNELTIAACVSKLHAGHLTNEFTRHGVAAEIIIAETPVEEREQIFARARAGITKVLLSVNCLVEGVDLPECSVLINARPVKSKARFVQLVGRVLRYLPGKTARVYDHAGAFLDPDLGFVENIDIDELPRGDDGMKEQRQIKKEIERLEKAPKECTKCKYLKPVGMYVCGKCGFKPQAGEEVETDVSRKLVSLRTTLDKNKPVSKEDKQQFWSELKGWQKERAIAGKSIKDGALAYKYRDKFQVWPKGLNDTAKVPSPETRNWIQSQNIRFAKGSAKRANV